MVKSKKQTPRPQVSPARAAAFEILLRVERESSYASELLHSRTYENLATNNHALATELVMGVLRWRSLLDSEIARAAAQPLAKLDLEILTALRLALYQLRWLRIPARAAIHESVELVKRARKRSAAPFVNAVLRKLALDKPATDQPAQDKATSAPLPTSAITNATPEALAQSAAHPLWLVERWFQAYGGDAALRICEHDQSIPRTTIRLRWEDESKIVEQLQAEGIELGSGALLSSARQVLRGDITKTAAFRAGLCPIQDEASQLVAALVGPGARILDCCAAPGGKTAAIADANPHAQIVAVDLHPHRARLLKSRLTTAHPESTHSSRNISVVAADARHLTFIANFDRVLADVPCSGTGTLARHPEIKWHLVPADFADLQARQIAILLSAMQPVAAGGRVIYSTCSLEKEENEDVIARALEENPAFRVVDCGLELEQLQQQGILLWPSIPSLTRPSLTRGPFLRTLPGLHPCDGFFAAILEKL
jgi:16S rRNA (cytosine967-C5)-methyltransferase